MGGIAGLPFPHSVQGAAGIANNSPIAVPGIKADDVLLAVIQHNVTDDTIVGLDPSDFEVADGEIESATANTAGDLVTVVYASRTASAS